MDCIQLSLFGKTCQEHSAPTAEKISEPSWKNLPAWNSQTLQFLDLRVGGGRWSKAGAIAGNGWSLAWRQLDAQYWGVPQRRKRIALVVDFGGQRAAEILFERTSLSGKESDKCSTLKAKAGNIGNGSECLIAEKAIRWIVRRLTPVECERLQGYPDGYTDIGDWTDSKEKKHKYADSPRYKALGNSIALPQWFWLVQKMRPYLKEKPTLGSLFDGLGGFPLVWQRAYGDGTARWASEVDNFCIAITRKRFPDVEES